MTMVPNPTCKIESAHSGKKTGLFVNNPCPLKRKEKEKERESY